jgi:hypothetical protein
MRYPVPGGHKRRDLFVQVGAWTKSWRPCSVTNLFLRNPNKWKPDGIIYTNLAESSKESNGSKRAVLPMMMITIIRKMSPHALCIISIRINIPILQPIYRQLPFVMCNVLFAGRRNRAVWGVNTFGSLGGHDRGFESHSRHGCLVCVCVSCA